MTQFNVYVEFDAPDITPEACSEIHEDLLDHSPAVGIAPNSHLSIRLFVESDSPLNAGTHGLEYAQGAAMKYGISPAAVQGFEVLTEAEFDRRLDLPAVPELAGTAEAADIIKVSRTRVGQLLKDGDLAPYHVQALASGPLFDAEGLRRYAATEHKGTRGRPKAEIPLTDLERALLEVLAAASVHAPLPSAGELYEMAAGAVDGSVGRAQVRLHQQPAFSALPGALDSLVGHRLVRTRSVSLKEAAGGHEDDLVVTVLGKGLRHAGVEAPAAGAKEQS
ncbi:hypothetical protein [Streptomyces sp. NBC_01304]|uniref:hypothetical protein n=1 Tax=Streptomyces sp. NBC_01304 TaxID=2903818 RepID=UPI002E148FAC|nr:hypothetical protein OG430_48520 [Streptomyces sp. NBC_01304]